MKILLTIANIIFIATAVADTGGPY